MAARIASSAPDIATAPGIAARELPGRGRGLCATEQILRDQMLFVSTAFGFSVHPHAQTSLCHGCLSFGSFLPHKCTGCAATYCCQECRQDDLGAGHALCCAAIARVGAMSDRKATANERGSACFILRAFARRRAGERSTPLHADAAMPTCLPMPSFSDALSQCTDHDEVPGFETRERERVRAVHIAVMQAGKLVSPTHEALHLLRNEPHNSYTFRDTSGAAQGWIMYPHSSLMNHSCFPNCACVATGGALAFYALADISVGEELTQCYVELGDSESRPNSHPIYTYPVYFDVYHCCPSHLPHLITSRTRPSHPTPCPP